MELLDALGSTESGDVDAPDPAGLWHFAMFRHNTVEVPASRAALDPGRLNQGATVRAAMAQLAADAGPALRSVKRAVSDPGFFIIRGDGMYRSVTDASPVQLEGQGEASPSELPLDVIDRVERACHPLVNDPHLAGAPDWLANVEPASALPGGVPTSEALWPPGREVVTAFIAPDLPSAALEGVTALRGPLTSAVCLSRLQGRSLARILYLGDFLGPDAPTRVEVVMAYGRRLWAPPG